MKMKRFKKVLVVCSFIFFMGMSVSVFAQPGDPGDDPDEVPITGIEWLLIGGSMLGAKKVYDKFKSKA